MTDFTNIPTDSAPVPTPSATPPASGGARPFADYFSLAWEDFQRQPLLLIGLLLIPIIVQFAVMTPINIFIAIVQAQFETNSSQQPPTLAVVSVLLVVLGSLVNYALQFYMLIVTQRTALLISSGQTLSFGEAFRIGPQLLSCIAALLLTGLMIFAGTLCLILPGLILMLLTSYTLYFICSSNTGAIDAIKASFNLISNHFGTVLLMVLLMFALNLAGFLACGIGTLITVPMSYLMHARLFLDLSGVKIPENA